jgi:hypothetical protein
MRPWAAALEFDADGRFAAEQDAAHERLGDDLQVRALHRRMQIGSGGAGAPAAAPRELEPVSKVPVVNQFQRRTAFESDTCRSARAAGRGQIAPYLPSAIPEVISSVGWLSAVPDLRGL